MYQKVKAYMKEHGMVVDGDVVLAGVSGGGDSMAMLEMLKRYQAEAAFSLCAVHVHHGICIDPLKARRIRIRSIERRIFAIHLQQCLHKILQIPMLLFPKKEPVEFSLLAPLSKLTEFLPHK